MHGLDAPAAREVTYAWESASKPCMITADLRVGVSKPCMITDKVETLFVIMHGMVAPARRTSRL